MSMQLLDLRSIARALGPMLSARKRFVPDRGTASATALYASNCPQPAQTDS
jgi:hypothetical protein